jgi:hypothetical protein
VNPVSDWRAGIFDPNKSRAQLWDILKDEEWHTISECHDRIGRTFKDALRSLKKNGRPDGASHRLRRKQYNWEIEKDDAETKIRMQQLTAL